MVVQSDNATEPDGDPVDDDLEHHDEDEPQKLQARRVVHRAVPGFRGVEGVRIGPYNHAKRGPQRGLQKLMQHVRRGRQGAVRFSADGQKIVSSSGQIDGDDNTVRIWSAVTGKREQTMKGRRV